MWFCLFVCFFLGGGGVGGEIATLVCDGLRVFFVLSSDGDERKIGQHLCIYISNTYRNGSRYRDVCVHLHVKEGVALNRGIVALQNICCASVV